VEPIETNLVRYPKENKDAAHKAHGKTRHINKRIDLVAKEIARSYKKEVAEHNTMALDEFEDTNLLASVANFNYPFKSRITLVLVGR